MSALAEEIKQAVREALREELPRLLNPNKVALDPLAGLSVADAAKYAHKSPYAVRRAIADGALTASKPTGGREWTIIASDLEQWMGRKKSAPTPIDILERRRQILARAAGGSK